MDLKKITSILLTAVLTAGLSIPSLAADESKLPAFPGAEGGGKYTTGARGSDSIEVYHVTNLNPEGEGSLKDAVSKSGRIVVFDVSGVIKLPKKLNLEQPNITILGQTAPGDGITVAGSDIGLSADNTIIRYLRVRPTDEYEGEPDGLGGRWIDDIIVDHCSVSWGVDELLTVYAGSREKEGKEPARNVTVQYCISSEALRMSSHIKGAHGYGGIAGGDNYSFHHNLMAHNDSRNPRLDRNLLGTDIVNNVIYDWGINTIYGGEPYSYNKLEEFSKPELVTNVNIRDNYYKYGPSTRDNADHVRSRVFEATNDGKVMYNGEVLKSNAYIENNYVYGDEETTKNNWNHNDTVKNQENVNRLDKPVDMGVYEIPQQSAEDAYIEVLESAGASLPKRDSIDARIINDVRNGTGRIINQEEEQGGFTGITSETRVFEIPSEWKAANGMGDSKETDIVPSGEYMGYTWIEAYVNDWTAKQEKPSNPEIKVEAPATASYDTAIDKTNGKGSWLVTKSKEVSYKAQASADVEKMELYDGENQLKVYEGNKIDDNVTLEEGTHYLFSRAYNSKGEKTDSDTAIVYVNGNGLGKELYASAQIGDGSFGTKGAAWYDEGTDTYTIGGSGRIGGESDSCQFAYSLLKGDFSVKTKIEDIPKYENGVLSGIMVRTGLKGDAESVILGDGWLKGGENISVDKRIDGQNERLFMPLADGSQADNSKNEYPMPRYLKVERKADKLILSVSNDGVDWTNNDRKPMELSIPNWGETLYVGLATDSNDGLPMVPYYSQASFSGYSADAAEADYTRLSLQYDENGVLTGVSKDGNGEVSYKIYDIGAIIKE